MQQVTIEPSFSAWRIKARALLRAELSPVDVFWNDGRNGKRDLFPEWMGEESISAGRNFELRIPKAFIELAEVVSCHRDSAKWALLYRIVWRLTRGEESHLLRLDSDIDMQRANVFAKEVQRDCQKMRALVKFRKVETNREGRGELFRAWFEPLHDIVEYNASFFRKRYSEIDWSIETPDRCAHWDGVKLRFTDGVERKREETKNLYLRDEGRVSDVALVSEAPHEVVGPLHNVADGPDSCRACSLWEESLRTVHGSGNETAALMLVGDQPNEEDDLSGRAFDGPSGRMLDELLEESGLKREEIYITCAVKHFKWKSGGRHRVRENVNREEVEACRPWLLREIEKVNPRVIVTLGRSAAQAVIGPDFSLVSQRGLIKCVNEVGFNGAIITTVHPSFLLRMQDASDRDRETLKLIGDLRLAGDLAHKKPERVKVKY